MSDKELPKKAREFDMADHERLNPSITRRNLVTTVPKVALGSWLATERDKGLANPYLMLMMQGNSLRPPVYGLWAFGGNDLGAWPR